MVGVVSPCPYVKPLTRLNAGLITIAVPPGLLTCAVSPTRHMFLVLYTMPTALLYGVNQSHQRVGDTLMAYGIYLRR